LPELASFPLNPKLTFEELVVAAHNNLAYAACLKVVENPGKQYNPLFLYGPAGIGKTHLMQAVAHKFIESNSNIKYFYTSAERLKADIASALEQGTMRNLRDKYLSLDMLLLDDVQFLAELETIQVQFFHIFNDLLQQGKQVIMTSDRSPTQLLGMEERLRSRFEWGLNADIKTPDLEARMAILKKKQVSEGLQIGDEMLMFVAGKLRTNVRELEGFLRRMHAHVTLAKEEITLSLIFSVINDMAPQQEEQDVLRSEEGTDKTPGAISAPPVENTVKEIEAAFFCPKGQAEQYNVVDKHFKDIIEKHKLKFALKNSHTEFYDYKERLNYHSFVELCKAKNVLVAVVIGPPPDSPIPTQEFSDNLQAAFESQGVALELISWPELYKNYHYLNLALDIALVKQKW